MGLPEHLCAMLALGYVARAASFASSWAEVPLLRSAPDAPLPRTTIIVPARDEERSIETCVRSLLAQEWVDHDVIVLDDRSTDGTPAILARLAREDPRLRVLRGAELPEGWVGKPWALHQAARHARGAWLLFTDADTDHAPRGLASALALVRALDAHALSIATYQRMESFWERTILPSVLGSILFACGPIGAINDPARPERALANGQFILVSREAYDGLGGYEALRDEVADDLEFARRIKRDGRYRYILAAGESVASVRMYRSFREIWEGFTKNLALGSGGALLPIVAGSAALLGLSAVPPVLAVRGALRRRPGDVLEALACTLATAATAGWAIGKTKHPRALGLRQPLGTTILAAIALNSVRRLATGRGVAWRGRTYYPRSARSDMRKLG